MKKSKSILIVLTLLLVLVLPLALVGCDNNTGNEGTGGGNNSNTDSSTETAFTDIDGVPITVTGKIDRIACVGTGVLRMITYAGVQDRIVGIEDTDTKPDNELIKKPYTYANKEAFRKLKADGKSFGKGGGANPMPNVTKLVELKPQVVFCSFIDQTALKTLRDQLNAFNIPVVKVFIDTDISIPSARANIKKSFDIIGKICDVEERCNAVNNKINEIFTDLDNRTKNITPNNTCYIGAISYRGRHGIDWTYSNFSCLDAINTKTITDVLYPDKKGGYQINFEDIVNLNPKYIFVDISNKDLIKDNMTTKKEVINSIDAVKNGKVYSIISYNYYSTNIEYAFANSYYMGKILYPEQFADVDMKQKINELTLFFDGVELYDTMQSFGLKYGTVDLNAIE